MITDINEVKTMPRAKKESENFSCKIAADVYRMLEEYCVVSGLSKTRL